jgi:hypothetical protein
MPEENMKITKKLITERCLLEMISKGKKTVRVPEGSIITPLARMRIEEGGISVYE